VTATRQIADTTHHLTCPHPRAQLAERRPFVGVEPDVPALPDEQRVLQCGGTTATALEHGLMVLSTSRTLTTGQDRRTD
jgi:hypothetical protein